MSSKKPSNTAMDVSTAYDAMHIFLDSYWKRGGSSSADLAVLIGSLARDRDGFPMDPALWKDWEEAYERAKSSMENEINESANPS